MVCDGMISDESFRNAAPHVKPAFLARISEIPIFVFRSLLFALWVQDIFHVNANMFVEKNVFIVRNIQCDVSVLFS